MYLRPAHQSDSQNADKQFRFYHRSVAKSPQLLVDEVGEILGSTLSNIACVVNPEVIVIGGGVSKAGQILIDTIKKHYQETSFKACRDTRFELASLGNDAGIYGSMNLIINN